MTRIDLAGFKVPPYRLPDREMAKPCNNCPFVAEQQGRLYLAEERMAQIKDSLSLGQPFWCHKSVYQKKTELITTDEGFEEAPTYEGHYMLCKGAIDWATGNHAATVLKSAQEWLDTAEFSGLLIMDPDGWDRANYFESWVEPITREEFIRRKNNSTCLQASDAAKNERIEK